MLKKLPALYLQITVLSIGALIDLLTKNWGKEVEDEYAA